MIDFQPKFGNPKGSIECAAHDWLCDNLGCEGESVMKSLAQVISDAIKRERVVWDQQLGNEIEAAQPGMRDALEWIEAHDRYWTGFRAGQNSPYGRRACA